MKKNLSLVLLISLVISLAVPQGAVFGLDGEEQIIPEEASVVVHDALQEKAVDDNEAIKTQLSDELDSKIETVSTEDIIVETLAEKPEAPPVVTVTTPVVSEHFLAPQRKVYISAFQTTNGAAFIELHNSDTKIQSIYGWRLEIDYVGGEPPCNVSLEGYLFAKSKVLYERDGAATGSVNARKFTCGETKDIAQTFSLYDGETLVEKITPTLNDTQIWMRTSTTGNSTKDFRAYTDKDTLTDGYWYKPPVALEIDILEVMVNPRSCVTPDDGDDCYDFIKLHNTSGTKIDLSDYRLRSGFSNSASSAANTAYFSII